MNQRIKTFGRLSLCAAGIAPFGVSCQKAEVRPNVIIIYADDLGFGDISGNGSRTIATPHVDRVAREGVRFTNAHTAASTSTPARYGLLTGQYPWRKAGTGIAAGDAGMIIAPEQYTMANMFRQAGYTTGAVGKWHLGLGETARQAWNGTIAPGLNDIGFDYSFIMAATGDRVPCVYIENQQVVNLDPSDPIAVSYAEPFPGEPTGEKNPELLRMTPSHGHNQAIVNGIPRIGYMKGGKQALWRDEEIGDRITEKALRFIGDNRDKPFFLYLGTNDIHVPRVPNERFIGKSGMGPRGDAILSFDHTVGKVLACLDSLGIADNTLLIISSDNGPVDGLSMLPTLLGREGQQEHEYLYWEFHESGGKMAVRMGDWKGIRLNVGTDPEGPIELYDLSTDIHEDRNVADEHPTIVARIAEIMRTARVPSPLFNFGQKNGAM